MRKPSRPGALKKLVPVTKPEPCGAMARAASKLASIVLGPLHGTVALWLTGRTDVRHVATITGIPIRSVSAAGRGLLETHILTHNGTTWQHSRPKATERAAFYAKLVDCTGKAPRNLETHKTARQIFKARKRSSSQQLPANTALASSRKNPRVPRN